MRTWPSDSTFNQYLLHVHIYLCKHTSTKVHGMLRVHGDTPRVIIHNNHSTSSHWPRCRMCVSYLPYPRRMRIFRAVRVLQIRAPVDPVVGPLLDAGCRCIPRFSRCRIRGHTSDGVTVTVTLPPFRHHGLRLCRVLTVTSWVTAPGSTE